MYTYILVGHTVVGAFSTKLARTRCLNRLAPGTHPEIKKGSQPRGYPSRLTTQKHPTKVRQRSVNLPEAAKIRYLKPGEFKL